MLSAPQRSCTGRDVISRTTGSRCCAWLRNRASNDGVLRCRAPLAFPAASTASLLLILLLAVSAVAEETPAFTLDRITTATLEELLDIRITSFSKVPEPLQRTPAPVFVITAREIRRSGATSVPEVLRMVPGVNVARLDANKWAVSVRGFNGRGANKLLVLLDGRTLYNPLFSGTVWEMRDVSLKDVERIEVVRGPGGSTWGANAVNGVINIITKHSKETQGTLITGGGGSEEKAFGSARYGGAVGEQTHYRVFGTYHNRDNGYLPDGASDDSHNGTGGFRLDSELSPKSDVTVQGKLFDGHHGGAMGDLNTVEAKGGAIQGSWVRRHGEKSALTVASFYEDYELDANFLVEKRKTFEIDIQESSFLTDWFTAITALQYRHTADKTAQDTLLMLLPHERSDDLVGASAAGRFELIPEKLSLHAGAKVEYNEYSRFELQPDIGVSWTINGSNTIWASIARAVRTPSRLESDAFVSLPEAGAISGNDDLDAETLLSYQAGYRALLSERAFVTFDVFYNEYHDLIVPVGSSILNDGKGETYGAELGLNWTASEHWRLHAAYSLLEGDFELDKGSAGNPAVVAPFEGNSPQHQLYLRSSHDIAERWQFDVALRYVDRLEQPHVSSYAVADAQLRFLATDNLQFAVVGQNLFDRHFEQGDPNATQVQPGVYGRVTVEF